MSDCRVPMPTYSKEIIKTEDCKDDLPPIPDGWMAISVPNAQLAMTEMGPNYHTIEVTAFGGHTIINKNFPKIFGVDFEVLILAKEKA